MTLIPVSAVGAALGKYQRPYDSPTPTVLVRTSGTSAVESSSMPGSREISFSTTDFTDISAMITSRMGNDGRATKMNHSSESIGTHKTIQSMSGRACAMLVAPGSRLMVPKTTGFGDSVAFDTQLSVEANWAPRSIASYHTILIPRFPPTFRCPDMPH